LACRSNDECALKSEVLAEDYRKIGSAWENSISQKRSELSERFIALALKGEVSEAAIEKFVKASLNRDTGKNAFLLKFAASVDKSANVYPALSGVLLKTLSDSTETSLARGYCAYALSRMNDERVVPLVKRLFESGEVYGHSRFFADALNNIEKDRRFLTALIRHKLDLRNPSECLLEELSGVLKCLVVSPQKVVKVLFSELLTEKN